MPLPKTGQLTADLPGLAVDDYIASIKVAALKVWPPQNPKMLDCVKPVCSSDHALVVHVYSLLESYSGYQGHPPLFLVVTTVRIFPWRAADRAQRSRC